MESIRWDSLYPFRNCFPVRTSYFWIVFVPIAAKAFSKLDEVEQLSFFGNVIPVNLQLPFSWEAFYFSSVFLAIGGALFDWWCPAIIKKYANYHEFVTSGGSELQIKVWFMQSTGLTMSDDATVREFVDVFCFSPEEYEENRGKTIGLQGFLTHLPIRNERMSNAFLFVRNCRNNENLRARVLIATFFGVGAALLLWVFGDAFLFVVGEVFN